MQLGTGLAAIEHVESLSGREVQALRQLVGHTANLIAENLSCISGVLVSICLYFFCSIVFQIFLLPIS